MILDERLDLRGKHSLFSPSQPSFFGYSPEEFYDKLINKYRSTLGTDIHEYAMYCIKRSHRIKSTRELISDIDQYIYSKYFIEKLDTIPKETKRELACLGAVAKNTPEIFETVKAYVNDAISFHMKTEVVLYYTDDFFGHADSLIFTKNMLRIHDLKTGVTPAHIEQLLGYAALFCLRNKIEPENIQTELRIYQTNDILIATPNPEEIRDYMECYRVFNDIIRTIEGGDA